MLTLDDTQEQIRDSARRFLADAAANRASERENWTAIAELGWLSAILTEEEGGFGGAKETALLAHEVGQASTLLPFLSNGILPVAFLGRLGLSGIGGVSLDDVLSGKRIIAGVGQGSCDLVTVIVSKSGVGGWSLSGSLDCVWGTEDADILLFLAELEGEGQSAIVAIDAAEARTAGALFATIDGGSMLKVDFAKCRVKPLEVLGGSAATNAWRHATDTTLLAQCAEIVGGMAHMFELTREYLTVRRQFGETLASFQALRHRLADMFAELDQADAMLNAGLSALELRDVETRSRVMSACRLRVGLAAKYLSAQAIQLHGGIGLTEEYALGKYYRRCLVLRKMWGDEEYHAGRMGNGSPPRSGEPSVNKKPAGVA